MFWVLLWVVLVVGAVVVLALVGLKLFRQGKALVAEVATLSDRLASVTSALDTMAQDTAERSGADARAGRAGRPTRR